MLVDDLKEYFGTNKVFTIKDILKAETKFSRARIYQLLDEEIKSNKIIKIDDGDFYIKGGKKGLTLIEILTQMYITDGVNRFGFFSGNMLLEKFDMYDKYNRRIQIKNYPFVISNRERSMGRYVTILNETVYLRKPKIKLTNENIDMTTLFQLFASVGIEVYVDHEKFADKKIKKFIKDKNLKIEQYLQFMDLYPPSCINKLQRAGVPQNIIEHEYPDDPFDPKSPNYRFK